MVETLVEKKVVPEYIPLPEKQISCPFVDGQDCQKEKCGLWFEDGYGNSCCSLRAIAQFLERIANSMRK